MVDTVGLSLYVGDAGGVRFLKETPKYFEIDPAGCHYDVDGNLVSVTGKLGNLSVIVKEACANITKGSLCKWYLGDNCKSMTRRDCQDAITLLSDTLHLPMGKARVTRLDVAANVIVKDPVTTYFSYMGDMTRAQRSERGTTLYYYKGKNQVFCLYDKNQEAVTDKSPVPEPYQGHNVMRLEQRYLHRVASQFKVKAVTGESLYDEPFYMSMWDKWKEGYQSIRKVNDLTPDFSMIKKPSDFTTAAELAYIQGNGGELAVCSMIEAARRRGDIGKTQAYRLIAKVKDVCKLGNGFTVQSEAIVELDKKVNEACMYYR